MTREEIEQLYVEEPNSFETDREEQWYKVGLKEGLATADNSRWIPVERELPKHDVEENGLITYPSVLVCLYDGFRDESYYDDIRGKWGDWDGEVEYWMPMPEAPTPRKED